MENLLILGGWATLIVMLIITVLGITDRIVIFLDLKDFIISCGPIYIVCAAYVIFYSLDIPSIGPVQHYSDIYEFLLFDTSTTIVTISAVLLSISCLVLSLSAAINSNGLIFGLVIFLYKFVSSIVLSILVISKFNDLIDKLSTYSIRFSALILLGIFTWIINRLINGERVLKKRESRNTADQEPQEN